MPVRSLLGTQAAQRVADRVRTFSGALTDLADQGWTPPPLAETVVLQTHCRELPCRSSQKPF
ncbi:hypothetical protein [Streptomyces hawaiiensis]|jgi:hypothetical protein|uniref:Uncharacterized protein n=1 Tax=Streptomyces hawaiiensis TaxID=67305 RepID=A0A6G5RR84_9ACTN|nr:hypothetical protein [Streptomyces hawaiiensis]QCD60067.1 hypothetical protein CEB94_38790 [Streptomyces hawaiiensis]